MIRHHKVVAMKYLNHMRITHLPQNFLQMEDNEMMPITLGKLKTSNYY